MKILETEINFQVTRLHRLRNVRNKWCESLLHSSDAQGDSFHCTCRAVPTPEGHFKLELLQNFQWRLGRERVGEGVRLLPEQTFGNLSGFPHKLLLRKISNVHRTKFLFSLRPQNYASLVHQEPNQNLPRTPDSLLALTIKPYPLPYRNKRRSTECVSTLHSCLSADNT